ncbi:hypothetical protein JCGZ_13846 [Jatropha curcas]|uniref:Aminotransferase-like plant mobile domain-containing protein n=1 Tax=Jatropha curcas TaxID=180498 RepID=A0A067KKC1_JATCU|nr:hypothetical protein JCGZ_13846 [Jatropha curcas]
MWPPSQLGLIGFVGSSRISNKIDLMKIPSKLGLIGLKHFDLIIWPPTQLDLIGFIGSRRVRRGILEAQFDRPESCWFDGKVFEARRIRRGILEARFDQPERSGFCPGQLRNSTSLTGEESSNSFAIHHHCLEFEIGIFFTILLSKFARGSDESNWLFIRPLKVWSYEYRIYPGGPSGDSPAESRRIPHYLAHCHHTYASGEDPEYWRSFLNDWELSDMFLTPWDCEAWRTYPGREVAELHTRSRLLMRGY